MFCKTIKVKPTANSTAEKTKKNNVNDSIFKSLFKNAINNAKPYKAIQINSAVSNKYKVLLLFIKKLKNIIKKIKIKKFKSPKFI